MNPDLTMCRSGEPVWFLHPAMTAITWEDLSFYLSNLNRYNGGMKWNLAKHHTLGILLIDILWPGSSPEYRWKLKRYFACHDLHEIVVGDVVSGLKRLLPDFKRIEILWEEHFHARFGLTLPEGVDREYVKYVDLLCVLYESWLHALPVYEHAQRNNPEMVLTKEGKDLVTSVENMTDEECVEFLRGILEKEKYEQESYYGVA